MIHKTIFGGTNLVYAEINMIIFYHLAKVYGNFGIL